MRAHNINVGRPVQSAFDRYLRSLKICLLWLSLLRWEKSQTVLSSCEPSGSNIKGLGGAVLVDQGAYQLSYGLHIEELTTVILGTHRIFATANHHANQSVCKRRNLSFSACDRMASPR